MKMWRKCNNKLVSLYYELCNWVLVLYEILYEDNINYHNTY